MSSSFGRNGRLWCSHCQAPRTSPAVAAAVAHERLDAAEGLRAFAHQHLSNEEQRDDQPEDHHQRQESRAEPGTETPRKARLRRREADDEHPGPGDLNQKRLHDPVGKDGGQHQCAVEGEARDLFRLRVSVIGLPLRSSIPGSQPTHGRSGTTRIVEVDI